MSSITGSAGLACSALRVVAHNRKEHKMAMSDVCVDCRNAPASILFQDEANGEAIPLCYNCVDKRKDDDDVKEGLVPAPLLGSDDVIICDEDDGSID